MKNRSMILLGCSLLLASCNSADGGAPTGQVVATVDGDEITVAELHQEMDNLKANGAGGAGLQQAALESIVNRKQLAAAAREAKLDLEPATALRKKKMDDMVLVDALTEQTRKSVPTPSQEEAQQYVNDHPASFAQRRIFVVDQIIALSNSPKLIKQMEPLNTMADVEKLLVANHVKYNKTVGVIDALSIDADAAEKMASLPAGAVFVSPDTDNNLRVNVIRDTAIQPLATDAAIKVALETLRARRSNEMVQNKINEIVAAGAAKVKYNPAFATTKIASKTNGK